MLPLHNLNSIMQEDVDSHKNSTKEITISINKL
jgi:hypothetical protein